MLSEEYVCTTNCGGYIVNIGMDDAGQQYFAQWIDEHNCANELCFGAYNSYWEDDLKLYFEKKSTNRGLK